MQFLIRDQDDQEPQQEQNIVMQSLIWTYVEWLLVADFF